MRGQVGARGTANNRRVLTHEIVDRKGQQYGCARRADIVKATGDDLPSRTRASYMVRSLSVTSPSPGSDGACRDAKFRSTGDFGEIPLNPRIFPGEAQRQTPSSAEQGPVAGAAKWKAAVC